jgi:hypothetical protein
MAKIITPYERLMRAFKEFVNKTTNRPKIEMWHYPLKQLSEGWRLDNLYERVAAAEQLDYDVQLKATKLGLEVVYIKKVPCKPFEVS